jgi:hypothetical protein
VRTNMLKATTPFPAICQFWCGRFNIFRMKIEILY